MTTPNELTLKQRITALPTPPAPISIVWVTLHPYQDQPLEVLLHCPLMSNPDDERETIDALWDNGMGPVTGREGRFKRLYKTTRDGCYSIATTEGVELATCLLVEHFIENRRSELIQAQLELQYAQEAVEYAERLPEIINEQEQSK